MIHIKNSEIQTDNIDIDQYGNFSGEPPLGTIIAIHPDLIDQISNYWHLCDGSNIDFRDKNNNIISKTIPNLLDNRFICSNSIQDITPRGKNIEHYHTITNIVSSMTLSDVTETHDHPRVSYSPNYINYYNDATETHRTKSNDSGAKTYHDLLYDKQNTSSITDSGHGHSNITKTITIGSGNNIINNIEANMPKYFKLNYYIKIK